MARPLRIEDAGAVCHVTSRGNARRPIFKDDKAREMLLNLLEKARTYYSTVSRLMREIESKTSKFKTPILLQLS